MTSERCENCGRRFDRPGGYECDEPGHPSPTLSQRIVADIESELTSRRGMRWDGIDYDVKDGIRDKLAQIVDDHLAGVLA